MNNAVQAAGVHSGVVLGLEMGKYPVILPQVSPGTAELPSISNFSFRLIMLMMSLIVVIEIIIPQRIRNFFHL